MSTHERPRLRFASAAAVLSLLAAFVAAPRSASADQCCYALCRSLKGATAGVQVTCREGKQDCPRSLGACMVFAQRSAGVACGKQRDCSTGLHEEADAESLLLRLASDDALVVLQPVRARLGSGATVSFVPAP